MSTANGGINFNEYNMRAPTFLPVTGTGYKLGDLKLTGISDNGYSRVMFLNKGGATAKITAEMVGEDCFKEYEGKSAIFKYYPSGDEYEGWYLADDWDYSMFILDDIVKIKATIRRAHALIADSESAPDLQSSVNSGARLECSACAAKGR